MRPRFTRPYPLSWWSASSHRRVRHVLVNSIGGRSGSAVTSPRKLKREKKVVQVERADSDLHVALRPIEAGTPPAHRTAEVDSGPPRLCRCAAHVFGISSIRGFTIDASAGAFGS